MVDNQIHYNDGAAYERMMGTWSRLAGQIFIDWLAPPSGLRWIDVGCGTGAFSALVVEHCKAAEVQGVDPSEAQIAFARTRPAAQLAEFRQGDASALPFDDRRFDAAVMALVIFFVPEPAKGVAEMARVVCPGGIVAAYVWDILGGGHPLDSMQAEMRAMGAAPPRPPRSDASQIEVLQKLWADAGLDAVEAQAMKVHRTFTDFEEFWTTSLSGSGTGPLVSSLMPSNAARLKARVRELYPADAQGRIFCTAGFNVIKGRVPG
jgi:SAM-dependent methyltransferase